MAKKSSPGPLIALAALGAGLFAVFSSKKASALEPGVPSSSLPPPNQQQPPGTPGTTTLPGGTTVPAPSLPATPAPSNVQSVPITINGHAWKLVPITGQNVGTVDVYAQRGAFGPHEELRVCRFTQVNSQAPRMLAGVAQGVPEAVLQAALKDLEIKVPASGSAPTTTTPAGRPPMPSSLQQEMIAVMGALGVDASGVVRGPTTPDAVRHATELASRLDQAGYPEAGAQMRAYAQAASKLLPPPPAPAPAIPGVPAELMAQIQKALELERDPQKLAVLRTALTTLPPSPERDMLIGALDALILQIKTAQAISQAATEIDEQMKQPLPAIPAPSGSKPRVLKLVSPNMQGPDVGDWQRVLKASGYNIDVDNVFGPNTDAATKDWQSKRGLTPDGDVGELTRAKIGTPPTAPLAVPTTASPRPDPKPKTQVQVAADATATHLLALQQKYGVAGSKGRQDLTLVKRFQGLVGGTADGMPGVNTILALARNGVGVLPAVMYWPKAATKAKDLPAFRSQLQAIANSAKASNPTLAAQIEASAARETGAGGLK